MGDFPYNPLDKRNLGESVARALLDRPISALPPEKPFNGAGIYAIYYIGDVDMYAPIRDKNLDDKYEQPIYVGKAVPKGARKGGFGLGENPGTVLYDRLKQHANSIKKAPDLRIEDFRCRYLVSDDIWIPLGESLLIERFKPLWNSLIDGFGIHDPGSGRSNQRRSTWDTLHSGRSFAEKRPENVRSREEIAKLIQDHLAVKSVPLIPTDEAVTEEDQD